MPLRVHHYDQVIPKPQQSGGDPQNHNKVVWGIVGTAARFTACQINLVGIMSLDDRRLVQHRHVEINREEDGVSHLFFTQLQKQLAMLSSNCYTSLPSHPFENGSRKHCHHHQIFCR